MPAALWALAIAALGIGTTEFVIAGLLPSISAEFGISIPMAGNMATSYALGVFFGAPVTIILGARLPQKTMLALLLVLFILGNVITATAPSFAIALAGRVITSLTHGAFFGIGSIMAADLVAPSRRTSAIAFMFTGLTLATLIGAPVGTWLAQTMSWRATFFAITAIGVLAIAGVVLLVPRAEYREPRSCEESWRPSPMFVSSSSWELQSSVRRRSSRQFTYIAPMMTPHCRIQLRGSDSAASAVQTRTFVGNILNGRFADRALMPLLYVTLSAQAAVLLAFYFRTGNQIASAMCIFLMSMFGFAPSRPSKSW